ncbi:MAG: hypothetical protein V4563_17050 [Pseudomonadota bacterium]
MDDAHFESETAFEYDDYEDLPYVWDSSLRRYRDAETGGFVKTAFAEIKNDEECERQEELKINADNDFWFRD